MICFGGYRVFEIRSPVLALLRAISDCRSIDVVFAGLFPENCGSPLRRSKDFSWLDISVVPLVTFRKFFRCHLMKNGRRRGEMNWGQAPAELEKEGKNTSRKDYSLRSVTKSLPPHESSHSGTLHIESMNRGPS